MILRNLSATRWALVALVLAAGGLPLILGPDPVTVPEHHLQHALLLIGGGAVGFLAYPPHSRSGAGCGSVGWLAIGLFAPLMIMFQMNPATYAYIEIHEAVHTFDHLIMEALAALTTYAGQRYLRGLGWVTGAALELMALLAVWGYGVVIG
ncbi:MAG TPA: hypothetical protein VFK80_06320 [Limnochordia bacterium]|nr:hypothetical protein [Limnochordia bacterium]